MFNKLVIANRGEIALRILRACWELGVKTVAAHSEVDRDQKHVLMADETVCIGPAPAPQSYLNIPALPSAAEVTDAEATPPGYGFLAENATFAEQAESSGFVFVGPRPETIRVMGDKLSGIAAMKKIGISCVPGSNGALPGGVEQALAGRLAAAKDLVSRIEMEDLRRKFAQLAKMSTEDLIALNVKKAD